MTPEVKIYVARVAGVFSGLFAFGLILMAFKYSDRFNRKDGE